MPALNIAPPAIPATSYARSWANSWTDPDNGLLTEADLQLLAHVNCSYLSSHRPPTLLALKQHAQSLAILIQRLTVSDNRAIINDNGAATNTTITNANGGAPFRQHDAFDWLNDLRTPYNNDDESHHLPIRGLMNTIEKESERDGPQCHCPLKTVRVPETFEDERPFATHQNLVMHANACLKLLDHEFSATGGLMSVLPSAYDADAGQLGAARNTLLGQWLLHHQALIRRLHELEINYTNALAAVEGIAVSPRHGDTSGGNDTSTSTVPIHQDELLIVGNRKVVYERIHTILDRAEAQIEKKQKLWWDQGVSGEAMWMKQRGGEWYAKGLVPIDLETRFFRIKGQGRRGKLFMMPAIKQNAALEHLLDMERRPTVVSVVTPRWAERATALEVAMKNKGKGKGLGKFGGAGDADANDGDYYDGAAGEGNEGREFRVKVLQDMLQVKDTQLEMVTTALTFYERTTDMEAREQIDEMLHTLNEYKERVKELERQLPGDMDSLGSDYEM